jgi:uncharacterized protein with FMN-binding domain
MQRAPIVLAATALGLAATLGFNAHRPTATAAATATTATSSPRTSGSSRRTVTGDPVATQYGDVQLKVTIAGGAITGVQAIALPSNDPKSVAISSYAEPLLRQSALTRGSANVDTVSGATYTSDGYRTALQAALDTAGTTSSASG